MSVLHLHIEAASADELHAQIKALHAQAAGDCYLRMTTTEDLLVELRQRLAVDGFVVRVLKHDADEIEHVRTETGEAEAAPEKAPTKAELKAAAKAAAEATKATKTPEAPKPIDPASATAQAMVGQPGTPGAPETPTIEMVRAALDTFAASKGQMPARQKMTEITGAAKLMEVPKEKYGALIDGLKLAA